MQEKHLRSALIKLAHTNPDLRKDLLPLLEKTASQDVRVAFSQYEKSLLAVLKDAGKLKNILATAPEGKMPGGRFKIHAFNVLQNLVYGSGPGNLDDLRKDVEAMEAQGAGSEDEGPSDGRKYWWEEGRVTG